jgi:hypothetical protein
LNFLRLARADADQTPEFTQEAFMKFGIHNPSFVFGSDPAEAFEGLKTKAQ